MTDAAPHLRQRNWPWVVLIAALAIGFAVNAILASRTKSATFDEPVHTLSSWMIVNTGDFRINPEHPALWKYVAGLGLIGQPLAVVTEARHSTMILSQLELQWPFAVDTLYRAADEANPLYGERLVMRARVAMSLFAVALALIVARWAWAWGGRGAAVIATLLLVFDPNFLAHSALVTNDVAAAACIALAGYLTWRIGTRYSRGIAIALVLTCAAGAGIKFTCLLLAPMVGIPLFWRAIESAPWRVGKAGRMLDSRGSRIGLVIGIGIVTVIVAILMLWPMYQFRDEPTPMTGLRFDDSYPRFLYGFNQLQLEQERDPSRPTLAGEALRQAAMAHPISSMAKLFFWVTQHHIVPQAWGYGLSYVDARSSLRDSFLMGEHSIHGFVSFFPLAMLFKTPLSTLIALLACGVGGIALSIRRVGDAATRWKLVCLIVPPTIYFGVSMASNLNIGLRHVLPVYPPMYVAAGVLMMRAIRNSMAAKIAVSLLVAGLVVESVSAFPNYIPFFNALAGGTRGGLSLLGDSNLDWGQDLPALAQWEHEWRRTHPTEPFYFSYFGLVPPSVYGIDSINAVPGYDFDLKPPTNNLNGGVYAVSATHLQSVYSPEMKAGMDMLRQRTPLAIINGTIYIYSMRTTSTSPSTNAATNAATTQAVRP